MDLKLPCKEQKQRPVGFSDNAETRFSALIASKTRLESSFGKKEMRTAPFFFPKIKPKKGQTDFGATVYQCRPQASLQNIKFDDIERSFLASLNQNRKLEASINEFTSQNRLLKTKISAAKELTEKIKGHNTILNNQVEIQNELLKEAITANLRLKTEVKKQRLANEERRSQLRESDDACQALRNKKITAEREIADFEDEEELFLAETEQERTQEAANQSICADLELEIAVKESIMSKMDRDCELVYLRMEALRLETLELKNRQVEATTVHFQKLRELESLKAVNSVKQADVDQLITRIRMLELENDMIIQKLAEMQGEFPDDLSQSFEAVSASL